MQLIKEKKYTEVKGIIGITNIEDFINLLINYFQSTFIPLDKWLTRQERKFFVCCVIIDNKGLKYTDKEAKYIFKDIFNLRRQSDVRGYLGDLEKKGFLFSDVVTKELNVVEFFKFDIKNQAFKVDIKLNFEDGEN